MSKSGNDKYRENYDKIFEKNKPHFIEEKNINTTNRKFTKKSRYIFDHIRGKKIFITPKKDIENG
jgi:hypothetical protein